jgi:hypothetical protein
VSLAWIRGGRRREKCQLVHGRRNAADGSEEERGRISRIGCRYLRALEREVREHASIGEYLPMSTRP